MRDRCTRYNRLRRAAELYVHVQHALRVYTYTYLYGVYYNVIIYYNIIMYAHAPKTRTLVPSLTR